MKRLSKSYLCAVIAILMIGISGCGEKPVMEVPELMDPVAVRESYRPVEYGDVGVIKVMFGTVVPTEHCYFRSVPITLSSVCVKNGDYVNPGDVIAYIDIGSAHEEILELKKSISQQNSLFEKDNEMYILKHQELEFASTLAYENNDMETVNQIQKEIATLEENHQYDSKLHEYQLTQLRTEIKEREKLVAEEMIVARESGFVTYIKDTSTTNQILPYENVAVVSDFDDRYIEADSITMAQGSRNLAGVDAFKRFYTELNQQRYALEEYEYSPQEMVMIENKALYPMMRFRFSEDGELPEAGTSVPIFMTINAVENVLRVANDSIFQDTQGKFVYVLVDGKKEIRHIEIGKVGASYTEVLSGVSEGELVNYSVNNMMPDQYAEYPISLTDYSPAISAKNFIKASSDATTCYSDYDGQLVEILIKDKDIVKKGDLICKIKSDKSSAKLRELLDSITATEENYEVLQKSYEDQRNSIYQQKVAAANELAGELSALQNRLDSGKNEAGKEMTQAERDVIQRQIDDSRRKGEYRQKQFELMTSQIDCEEEKSLIEYQYEKQQKQKEYAKAKENNDGSGLIQIYAEADGICSISHISVNKNIKQGDLLFSIQSEKSDIVVFTSSNGIKIDQTVTFYNEDRSKSYTGKVIAVADPERVYLTEQEGHIYLSTNQTDSKSKKYLITVSDSAFFEEDEAFEMMFPQYNLYDTVLVPARTVQYETIEKTEYQYVWRVVDDMLVKQYVTKLYDGVFNRQEECIISGLKPGDVIAIDPEGK